MLILLTGATGFIGRHVLTALLEKYGSQSVMVLSSKKITNVNCKIYASTRDFGIEQNAFNKVTHIIHAGAFTPKSSRSRNEISACFSNIEYTKNLLSYKFDALVRVVNISAVDVYGNSDAKLSENSLIAPESLYGSSKLYCEQMIKSFSRINQNDYINMRLGHVYGPGEEKYKKILPVAIKNILNNQHVDLWGDGSELRSFIFIDDVVKSIVNALTYPEGGLNINVVSSRQTSILELLNLLMLVSEKHTEIRVIESNHIKRNVIFNNKTLMETVLEEETDLMLGLKSEYEYMKRMHESGI